MDKEKSETAHQEEEYSELNTSVKSLNYNETKNFKSLLPQILGAVISMSNFLLTGTTLVFSAILIPQLEAENDILVTKTQTSWIASVVALAAPLGCLLGGYITDKWGRITALKISVVPGIIGWVLIATADSVSMLIIGRIFTGLTSTLATNPAVVYVTEISRKDMRGALLNLSPIYVSLGMIIGYLKGWLLHWRLVAWLCNIYVILSFIFCFFIPESPIWLISKGRIDEAKKSLTWLHRYQPKPKNQEQSYAEIQLLKAEEQRKNVIKHKNVSIFREFLKPTGYKPMLIISGVVIFQQFSGIYIFLSYSVTFFRNVGTNFNPYIASVTIGVIRLVISFLDTWTLKYFNRRTLIMISGLGMTICMLISALFTSWIKNETTNLTWVPVVFLLLYDVSFMIGLLPIPWSLTAELFPLKIRGIANGISTSILYVMMYLAVQNYYNMEIVFGGSAGLQWFFAGISFSAVIFVLLFLPETHNKKLSEVENYFKYNIIYVRQNKKEIVKNVDCDKNENDNLIKHI